MFFADYISVLLKSFSLFNDMWCFRFRLGFYLIKIFHCIFFVFERKMICFPKYDIHAYYMYIFTCVYANAWASFNYLTTSFNRLLIFQQRSMIHCFVSDNANYCHKFLILFVNLLIINMHLNLIINSFYYFIISIFFYL